MQRTNSLSSILVVSWTENSVSKPLVATNIDIFLFTLLLTKLIDKSKLCMEFLLNLKDSSAAYSTVSLLLEMFLLFFPVSGRLQLLRLHYPWASVLRGNVLIKPIQNPKTWNQPTRSTTKDQPQTQRHPPQHEWKRSDWRILTAMPSGTRCPVQSEPLPLYCQNLYLFSFYWMNTMNWWRVEREPGSSPSCLWHQMKPRDRRQKGRKRWGAKAEVRSWEPTDSSRSLTS